MDIYENMSFCRSSAVKYRCDTILCGRFKERECYFVIISTARGTAKKASASFIIQHHGGRTKNNIDLTMAGEPDPHLASLTADDDGGMIDKSPILISSGGAEGVDDLMVRIISTNTDDSNDNKNGANETTTTTTAPQEEDNTTLMGKMNNNNNPLQTLGSNDSNTCIDLSPPLASLETASNETMLVMAATNNDADDDGHQHQQVIEPSCHAQEGEGSATTIKVINAKSSDDSSDTVNCSDASTINAAGPAMAAQTSAIVSDDIASHSDSNTLKNSDDANTNNISSNNSGNDHNMISERDVQLLEILNHRRKLLTWVRACRIQTQIVLREMSTSSNKGGNEKDEVEEQQQQRRQRRRRQGLITTLESSTTLQDGEDLSGTANQIMQPGGGEGFGIESLVNSEMATFQAITNMANRNPNSLKRPRPPSSVTESSNPRDLRRGPSVGKSFDACTTASASGSVSMPGGGGRSTTTTIHASPSTVSLPNAVEAQTSSSSSSTMTTIGKQFLNKNQPPHEDVPPTTSTLSNHASTSSFAIATSNTEKQKKSRKRKSNSNNNNNNSTFTNHDRLGSTLPFPPGGSSSHMTMTNNNAAALMRGNANNNSASSQMLSALVPSAAAVDLLAVRNGLLARLDSLLLQKPKKQRCGGPSDGNDITPPRMDVDQNDDDGVHVNMHDALSVGIDCKPTIDRDGNCSIPSVIGKRMPIPVVSQLVSSTGEKFGTAPAKYSPLSEAAVTIQPNELHSHLHHHPAPPLRLPIRRKTHWDCVLEEMKWSAADFHEERKWKIAAGQLLSASVRKYKPKKKKLSSSSSLVGITPTKLSQASRSGSIVSSSSRSTTMSVNSFSLNTSGFCMASNESSTFDPLYVDASIEDTETVRIISRLLSVGILDHWDSISSSSRYCEDMNARQQRFRRLVELESLGNDTVKLVRSKESNGHAQLGETGTRPRDDESLQSSNSTGAIRELRYDEISERIESSFKLAVMLKDQVVTTSLSKISSCGEMMGVELDQRQLRAVHFVERLWASTNGVKEGGSDTSYIEGAQMSAFNNDARSSISAIVGGSFGVGKTVAVCTLIWRNKIDGPQIVVCSPGAVVGI